MPARRDQWHPVPASMYSIRAVTRLYEPPLRDCFTTRRLLSPMGKRARVLCVPTVRGEAPEPEGLT